VHEAVDCGGSSHCVLEYLVPLGKDEVGADEHAFAFVAFGQIGIRVCNVMKMTGRAEKADILCCFGMVRQSCFLFGTGHYAPTATGALFFLPKKKKNGGFLCFCKKNDRGLDNLLL